MRNNEGRDEGRAPSAGVPRDMFGPGGVAGQMEHPPTIPAVPLEWIKQQPTTRAWWADSIRTSVGLAEIIDLALQLEGGFEGVCDWLQLIGFSTPSSAVIGTGTAWRVYVNEAPYFQTRMLHVGTLDESGRILMLEHSDGGGQTWGQVQIWLPEQARFTIGYNNNGGSSNPMGWMARGYYWPISLREEWVTRGWRK